MGGQPEVIEKLNKMEQDIKEMKQDIKEISTRVDLRNQYLKILTLLHNDFKSLAAKIILKD